MNEYVDITHHDTTRTKSSSHPVHIQDTMPTAVLVYLYLLVSSSGFFSDSPSSHPRLLSSLYHVSSPVGLLRYVLRYVWHSDAIPSLSNAIHSFIHLLACVTIAALPRITAMACFVACWFAAICTPVRVAL